MTMVKICGITNKRDAAFSYSCGADFLGFVFYNKSRRYVTPAKAKEIIRDLPRGVQKVGVFVNESAQSVRKIAKICGLDILQFHGDETPAYLSQFKGYKIIKAIRVREKLALDALRAFRPDYFLFDTFHKDAFGGSGKTFDWKLLKSFKKAKIPFFVSGGLTPKNVSALIIKIRPFAVDVSSGVESKPGKKDHAKIKGFIKTVKSQ